MKEVLTKKPWSCQYFNFYRPKHVWSMNRSHGDGTRWSISMWLRKEGIAMSVLIDCHFTFTFTCTFRHPMYYTHSRGKNSDELHSTDGSSLNSPTSLLSSGDHFFQSSNLPTVATSKWRDLCCLSCASWSNFLVPECFTNRLRSVECTR